MARESNQKNGNEEKKIRKRNSISWNRFLISSIENSKASQNGFVQNPFLIPPIFYKRLLLSFPSPRQSHNCRWNFSLNLRFASLHISFNRFKRRKKVTRPPLPQIRAEFESFHFLLVRRSYVIKRLVRTTWSSRGFSILFTGCTDR